MFRMEAASAQLCDVVRRMLRPGPLLELEPDDVVMSRMDHVESADFADD